MLQSLSLKNKADVALLKQISSVALFGYVPDTGVNSPIPTYPETVDYLDERMGNDGQTPRIRRKRQKVSLTPNGKEDLGTFFFLSSGKET